MLSYQIISLIFAGLFMFSGIFAIILLFYIGKTRIQKIDKAVYGYEFPHDSIFTLLIRMPGYASAFIWKWSAKRSGLEGKIEHFDAKFKWPFITSFFLFLFSIICLIIGILVDKYFGAI